MTLYRPLSLVHQVLKNHLSKESYVVDATCGQGHDSLFISSLLGRNGKLFLFDIQQAAITQTMHRLSDALPHTYFYQTSHAYLDDVLSAYHGQIDAVVFNLGFLPHTDESITTLLSSTLTAIDAAYLLLRLKGLIVIVTYPGHPEGLLEQQAIFQRIQQLKSNDAYVTSYQQINRDATGPIVYIIEKRSQKQLLFSH